MTWESFTKDSSNISTTRYEANTEILEVTFKNGGVYQYFGVPNQVWEAFKSAPSMGQFLAAQIKGHYRFSRV